MVSGFEGSWHQKAEDLKAKVRLMFDAKKNQSILLLIPLLFQRSHLWSEKLPDNTKANKAQLNDVIIQCIEE